PLEEVGAAAADEDVVAGLAEDQVAEEAGAGLDAVVTRAAVLDVVVGAPLECIVAVLAIQGIGAIAPVEHVIAESAAELVAPGAPRERVVAGTSQEQGVNGASLEAVVAIAAIELQLIDAERAERADHVVAGQAADLEQLDVAIERIR